MPRWIGDLAIDRKLMMIMMLTVTASLVVACFIFVLTDSFSTLQSTRQELRTLAGIVANNSVSVLDFQDAEVAQETLASLADTPSILGGCLYAKGGTPLAHYERPGVEMSCPLRRGAEMSGPSLEGGELVVMHPVLFQGERLGTVYLRSDLSRLTARLGPYLAGTLLAVGAASLIGLALSSRLKNLITSPILELAGAVQEVTRSQHYDTRVRGTTRDEIGLLMNGFNEMLEQIQLRDGELRKTQDSLEERVQERTAELEIARDVAQSASRAKSEFLANMSHEIRTPLNAVMGLTEVTLTTDLDDSQRDYLGTVRDSAESLLGVLNDILDFSKIEAGKLDLERVPFNIYDTVEDTLTALAMRAEGKGLELACDLDPELPPRLTGDPGRLRQVISNLVSNAIKFTDEGEVVLRVEPEIRDSALQVRFSVRDTGVGISPAHLDRIFEPFEQADTSTTRRFGGTGLGLSISRQLVELMGGEIRAQSTPDRGSTFSFTAYFEVPTESAVQQRGEALPLEGTRVLIVDDNQTNLTILDQVTRARGMRPALAASAQEGLRRLEEEHGSGDPIPLVISDVHMPDVDGFGLAEQIRADERFKDLGIVFLTSAGQTGDLARCQELGIFARLVKPVRQSELVRVMARALGVGGEADAPHADADQHARLIVERRAEVSLEPLRILLVEDSPANRKVALAILGNGGHTIAVAGNGREALELLEGQPFDVVLMDVQMPEMDGFETTAAIRAGETASGGHIPIIAMTAHALQGDREKCLAGGMDGYVSKPIRRSELFDALGRVAPPAEAPEPAPTGVVDWSELRSQLGDDPEVLREIVNAYLTEMREHLERLPGTIAAGQVAEVRRRAHTLKGALRTFGAQDAAREALALENLAAAGDLSGAEALFERVREATDPVLPELAAFAAG